MIDYRHIWHRLLQTKVLQNYSYMSLLNIAGALISVLIYPYLIRVMGVEAMGTYAYLLGIVMLLQSIEDFGFDLPATKRVSLAADQNQLNQIIRVVYACKFIMLLAAALVAIPVVLLIPDLRANAVLFAVIFAQIICFVLFPQWYYQGRKNMRVATIIQFTLRVCQIPLIFCFVHSADDLLYYAAIVSGTYLIGGLVGWANLFVEGRRWAHITLSDIGVFFRESTPFFVTSLSGMIKDKTLTIVIGSFIGMREVAIYDLATKIVQIPRLLINSINSALFPEVVTNSAPERVRTIIRYERWIGFLAMLGVIALGYPAVWLLGGKQMLNAYPVAVILSFTIYTYLVVGAYLQFVFVARGHYRVVAYNQIIAMCTCLAMCAVGMWIYPSAWVVALALSLSGGLEIVYCRYQTKKKQL